MHIARAMLQEVCELGALGVILAMIACVAAHFGA